MLALTIGIPMLVYSDLDEFGVCHNMAPRNVLLPYQWFVVVFYMIIPTTAVTFSYFKIIHFLVQQLRSSVCFNREDIRVQRIKENRRTVKLLMPILFTFVACVSPTFIIQLYVTYTGSDIASFDLYRGLVIFINVTYPLHACVNPIIYTIMDRRFRSDLQLMFGLKKKEEDDASATETTTLLTH